VSFLCLKRDIPEGEHVPFSQFGEEVVVKKEKGIIIVAQNRCKHRGMKVIDKCGKGTVYCFHHGQRFQFEQIVKHYEFGEFIFLPGFQSNSKIFEQLSEDIGEQFDEIKMEIKTPFYLWIQRQLDATHIKEMIDDGKVENENIGEFESSYDIKLSDKLIEQFKTDNHLLTQYMGFPNLAVTKVSDVYYIVHHVKPTKDGSMLYMRYFANKNSKLSKDMQSKILSDLGKIESKDKSIVEHWATTYKWPSDQAWLPGERAIMMYEKEIHTRELA